MTDETNEPLVTEGGYREIKRAIRANHRLKNEVKQARDRIARRKYEQKRLGRETSVSQPRVRTTSYWPGSTETKQSSTSDQKNQKPLYMTKSKGTIPFEKSGWCGSGETVNVRKNPTPSEFTRLFKKYPSGVRVLWYNGDWYVWNALESNHTRVYNKLGIDQGAMTHCDLTKARKPGSMYGFNLSRTPSWDAWGDNDDGSTKRKDTIFVSSDWFERSDLAWFRKRLKNDSKFVKMTSEWNVAGVHHQGNVLGTKEYLSTRKPKARNPNILTRAQLSNKIKKDIKLNLAEEISRKDFEGMLKNFIDFTVDKLKIKNPPKVEYKSPEDQGEQPSFGGYCPDTQKLLIVTKNRHPLDVFRSTAHELVHHKQNEDGRIGRDVRKEGETGSDIENEANSQAGILMRHYGKQNPHMFSHSHITEQKKEPSLNHTVIVGSDEWNSMSEKEKKKLVRPGKVPKSIRKSSSSYKNSNSTLNEGINDKGIFKAVFLCGGAGSGKNFVMSKVLDGLGLVELSSDKANEYLMKKNNLSFIMKPEERHKRDIVRGKAKMISHRQEEFHLGGRNGIIINGTGYDYNKIASQKRKLEEMGYETMMIFVGTSNKVGRQRNILRGQLGGRTIEEPDRFKRWMGANKSKDRYRDLFGQNFIYVDNSKNLDDLSPEERQKTEAMFLAVFKKVRNFVSKRVYNQHALEWMAREKSKRGINEKFEDMLINEVGGAGNDGTPMLTRRYQQDTPGQGIGFSPMKVLKLDKKGKRTSPIASDRIGSEYGFPKSPTMGDNQTLDLNYSPMPMSVWTPVQERFQKKYGDQWEQKLASVAESLDDPYSPAMGATPNSWVQDEVRPDQKADDEKASLFGSKKKKRKTLNELVRAKLFHTRRWKGAVVFDTGKHTYAPKNPPIKSVPIADIKASWEGFGKGHDSYDSSDHTTTMANKIRKGVKMPPILVRRNPRGVGYELVDGNHRYQAHLDANKKHIDVQVIPPVLAQGKPRKRITGKRKKL